MRKSKKQTLRLIITGIVARNMAVKVILDSNFLFIASEFHLDVFEELKSILSQRVDPVLLSPTYREIRKIAERGSPKMRQQASLALKLAEKCRLVQVAQNSQESCDDVIVRVAREWRSPVATNDGTLKRRLRNISLPVIYLRQKSRLEMEGSPDQEYKL